MKKPAATNRSCSRGRRPRESRETHRPAPGLSEPGYMAKALLAEVRRLIQSARQSVASVVDTFQVLTNFEIGRRIVEHEQKGEKRAAYGRGLLKGLSQRLTEEFGRGFSEDNLSNMRKFFLLWESRVVEFPNSLFGNSSPQICQQPSGKLVPLAISAQPMRKSPFTLSWSHYVEQLTVKALTR